MGNKRKRESSTVDSPKSIPTSIESRPSLDLNSKSTKSDHANSKSDGGDDGGQKGPKVQYIAAEGSNSWSKSLGTSAPELLGLANYKILNAIMQNLLNILVKSSEYQKSMRIN